LIGAIALTTIGLFIYGNEGLFSQKDRYVMYFESTVHGLEVGAPVKFKGVTIGQVSDILIRFNQDEKSNRIPVIVDISRDLLRENISREGLSKDDKSDDKRLNILIDSGLRAELAYQSYLTGLLYINIDFAPRQEAIFVQKTPTVYREIPTIGYELNEIWDNLISVMKEIRRVNIAQIGKDIEALVNRLYEGIDQLDLKGINDNILSVTRSMTALIKDIQTDITPMSDKMQKVLDDALGMIAKIRSAASGIENIVRSEGATGYELEGALREVRGAARAVKQLAQELERNPRMLLTGKKLPKKNKAS